MSTFGALSTRPGQEFRLDQAFAEPRDSGAFFTSDLSPPLGHSAPEVISTSELNSREDSCRSVNRLPLVEVLDWGQNIYFLKLGELRLMLEWVSRWRSQWQRLRATVGQAKGKDRNERPKPAKAQPVWEEALKVTES